MLSSVRITPQVPQPDVVAHLVEDEPHALGSGGDPAGRGAQETMLDVDRRAMTPFLGRNPVELQDVSVFCCSFLNFNLQILHLNTSIPTIIYISDLVPSLEYYILNL